MGNEIKPADSTALQKAGSPTFLNNGDGMQVGYIQNQTNYYNINGFMPSAIPTFVNAEYYNLFVMEQQALDGCFSIPRHKALDDFTEPEIRRIYAKPNLEAADEIKRLPSLFVIRNTGGNHTDLCHTAGYGYVADIQQKGDVITVMAAGLRPIQQERLNQLEKELQLLSAPESNELDCVHWAIKKVNLTQVLTEHKLLEGFIG